MNPEVLIENSSAQSVAKNKEIIFQDLGIMDYKECWDYQEKLFSEIVAQKTKNRDLPAEEQTSTKNYLLFVEHPHVYTLGKSGNEKNLLVNDFQLKEKEATYYKINRGGDITYHGPGQLVAYPVLDLDNFFTDIHKYLRLLEETIILTMKEYGIEGGRSKGETGVWLNADDVFKARKICAMGVRCSRWVTMHGWGFNVNTNLDYFSNIVPCGINNKAVTSMHKEVGNEINMNEMKEKLKNNFALLFEAQLV
ncbi:MAG: octanoyltransferase [Bacteroidetes bacterium]|jgi:lipoyl(octanoyl) transferase|nr:octanoyltransferase [Bacteroidota bacterium]